MVKPMATAESTAHTMKTIHGQGMPLLCPWSFDCACDWACASTDEELGDEPALDAWALEPDAEAFAPDADAELEPELENASDTDEAASLEAKAEAEADSEASSAACACAVSSLTVSV